MDQPRPRFKLTPKTRLNDIKYRSLFDVAALTIKEELYTKDNNPMKGMLKCAYREIAGTTKDSSKRKKAQKLRLAKNECSRLIENFCTETARESNEDTNKLKIKMQKLLAGAECFFLNEIRAEKFQPETL